MRGAFALDFLTRCKNAQLPLDVDVAAKYADTGWNTEIKARAVEIEPAYDPDGSLAAWLCYRGDRYLGSVCKVRRGWHVNNCEGGVLAVTRTRKEAFARISETASCKHEWQPHDVYGFNCVKCGSWEPAVDVYAK
jgi:hypothetical protein